MPRLPNVGDDSGTWGTILNEYLGVSHTSDGKIILEKWSNNSTRPSTPLIDQIGYNENTKVIEQYNGTDWITLVGGIQNNIIDPTKLNARAELYDNFANKSNGYTVQKKNTLPIIGNSYIVAVNTLGEDLLNPYVENGALRLGKNLTYFGGEHTEDVKSLTFEWEWFATENPTGASPQGITFAFSQNPIFDTATPNNNILLPLNMLHLQTQQGGPTQWGINTSLSNGVFVANTASFSNFSSPPSTLDWGYGGINNTIPSNIRNFVTLRISGDTVWITGSGYTKVFKDPRVSLGGIGKWWWIEWSGQRIYSQQMKIHRLWINSPQLDLAPGVNQPFSEILSRLSSGGNVSLPQKIKIGTSFTTGNPDNTESLAVSGLVGGQRFISKPYLNHGVFDTAQHFVFQTAPASSPANASNQNLGVWMSLFGLSIPGEREEFVYRGYFANNSNIKRIKISFFGSFIFDSGDLTTSDKEWELKLTRTFYTGIRYYMNITFTISGQNPILRFYSSNIGSDGNAAIQVTGVAAGDIIVRSGDGIKYTISN